MTRRAIKELLIVELEKRADEIEREGCSPLTSDGPTFRLEAAELRGLAAGVPLPWWAINRAKAWAIG